MKTSEKLNRIALLTNSAQIVVQMMFDEVTDTQVRIDEILRLLQMKEHASRTLLAEVRNNVLPLLRHGVSVYMLSDLLRAYEESINITLDQMELFASYLGNLTKMGETKTAYRNIAHHIREDFHSISDGIYSQSKVFEMQTPDEITQTEIIETWHNFK